MSKYPTVLSTEEVKRIFGSFSWRANGPSSIIIAPEWVEANIVTVYVPQLDGKPAYGGKSNGRIQWHRKGVEQLLHAWEAVEKAGLLSRVTLWGGSFVPRKVRGSTTSLSRHSWATAFDINPSENWLGEEPARVGKPGCIRELVPIFEAHGFCWGGRWQRQDGMHFEIAKLIDYPDTAFSHPAADEIETVPAAKLIVNDAWKKALALTLVNGVAYADAQDLAGLVSGGVFDPDADSDADPVTDAQRVPVGQYLTAHGFRRIVWNAEQKKVYAWRQ